MPRQLLRCLLLLPLLLTACGPDEAPEVEIPSWAKVAPEQIAEAKKHGVPVAFENDLGMKFVLIPAGTFLMGSPEDEEGRRADEGPQHQVTISRPFYMQVSEVTIGQYRRWKEGFTPQTDRTRASQPVSEVSWSDAVEYTAWTSDHDEAREYALPTEAQWEYACRAGTTTAYWNSDDPAGSSAVAWSRQNSDLDAHDVMSLPPNPWGLYDTHGNVWEWCSDHYQEFGPEPLVDPRGQSPTRSPNLRGGSYLHPAGWQRSAARHFGPRRVAGGDVGFRLVSPLPEPDA